MDYELEIKTLKNVKPRLFKKVNSQWFESVNESGQLGSNSGSSQVHGYWVKSHVMGIGYWFEPQALGRGLVLEMGSQIKLKVWLFGLDIKFDYLIWV